MATVVEYEATREQVIEFRTDVERVMESFEVSGPTAVPGPDTEGLVRSLREKWDPQRQTKGRRLSMGGLYGALNEAILRLPRLTERSKWYSALYDARGTAPFIEDE